MKATVLFYFDVRAYNEKGGNYGELYQKKY